VSSISAISGYHIGWRIALAVTAATVLMPGAALADDSGVAALAAGNASAPYMMIANSESSADRLPLKKTSAQVNIAGVIAHVHITQVFGNEGSKALEAVYVFPGSTRSAVFGMQMTVGDRKIVAKIDKREAAQKAFDSARSAGKTATLLEQQRPNVFAMNVTNVQPGDTVTVELDYTELIVPTDGVYEFVYPAVVGPRYSNGTEANKPDAQEWHENPHLAPGKTTPFAVNVTVTAGMGIAAMTSPSHPGAPKFAGKESASFAVTDGNRDVVLRYKLRGDAIQTGMLRFEDANEKFFLLMMQPPARIEPSSLPPREYIFVVDVSGSMSGFPLDTSKTLINNLLSDLRPIDSFNIVFFSGGNYQFNDKSVAATPANVARAKEVLSEQHGSGGTELLPALKRAMQLPNSDDTSRSFVVITDGFVTVESEAYKWIVDNVGRANVFSFGIGSLVNRALIEGLARAGKAEPFVVLSGNEAASKAKQFAQMVSSPVLTRIKINAEAIGGYDIDPGSVPDLFADRPVVVVGKYRKGTGSVIVTGRRGNQEFKSEINVSTAKPDGVNSPVRMLWARGQLATLADRESLGDAAAVDQGTAIALKYGLLSKHTSFIAVDTVKRGAGQVPVQTVQPLVMPSGVTQGDGSQYSFSGNDDSDGVLDANDAEQNESIVIQGSTPMIDFGSSMPIRQAGSDAQISTNREVEVATSLTLLTSRGNGAEVAPLRFTDVALWNLNLSASFIPRMRLSIGNTVLAKQTETLNERLWQSTGAQIAFNTSASSAAALSAKLGSLLGRSGYYGAVGLSWSTRKRMNQWMSWEGGLHGGVTSLSFKSDAPTSPWFAELGASAQMQVCFGECERRYGAAWLGFDFNRSIVHRPKDTSAVNAIDPRTTLNIEIGTFFRVTKVWDMSFSAGWSDRGDLAKPATQLPILDGGFDQLRLSVGLIAHWDLAPLASRINDNE
jgi:Ca-activated chloride channel homolog